SQVDAADQEIFIDDLEDIVKALPRRIEIAKENVTARLTSTIGMSYLDGDFLQAVTRLDAVISVTRNARILAIRLLVKFLLEPREDGRRHGVQHVSLREEALPITEIGRA